MLPSQRSSFRHRALSRLGHRAFSSLFDHRLPYRAALARRIVLRDLSRPQWALGALVVAMMLLGITFAPQMASAMRGAPDSELVVMTIPLDLPPGPEYEGIVDEAPTDGTPPEQLAFEEQQDEGWTIRIVQRGQTLGQVFQSVGIGGGTLHEFMSTSEETRGLVRLQPGQRIAFRSTAEGVVDAVAFDRGEDTRLLVERGTQGWTQTRIERPIERRIEHATVTISHSLFGDGARAGLSHALIMQMANAFAYDIDFALDLREGDQFSVIFESIYREGERLRDGDVLAASFVNRGRRFHAVRFVDDDGRAAFYNAEGRSLRRAFLRTPLEFTRISSRFSLGRHHPILNRMRAHRGVDYAAPTGTPVWSAGDGRVTFRGVRGGYGNTVVIQHSGNRETLYAHLSRFAPNLRVGQRIRQGEVIGFVGMTGLATGPHLHYEFRINGVHHDPLTVPLPKSEPLEGTALARFQAMASPLLAQLEFIESHALASANTR